MAGLLDKLARQVLNSLEPKKTTQSRPKTMSQTANRQAVVVMPVKPVDSVAEAKEPEKPYVAHLAENSEREETSVLSVNERMGW